MSSTSMSKRELSPETMEQPAAKKRTRVTKPTSFAPIKVSSEGAASAVDANPPLTQLVTAMSKVLKNPSKSQCIIYWMRLADLRVADNRALSQASEQAQQDGIPLIVLFIISPQDYLAHDRSPRRIDFTLRNLASIKETLSQLDIPLHTVTYTPRKKIPEKVISLLEFWGCTRFFANIEYEVDELRRDIEICTIALEKKIQANFIHNKSIVEPGVIVTKAGKAYAMYSPYQRNWLALVNNNISRYLGEARYPNRNMSSLRSSKKFAYLFETETPSSLPGFELVDTDRERMADLWPDGEEIAAEILAAFLSTKACSSQLGAVTPCPSSAKQDTKHNRITKYADDRDRADRNTTSRLSAYLSSGVISARAVVRATMRMLNSDKIESNGSTGIGRWLQEIAWRDFYADVLASFPRVSMGRPFLEKFSKVVWENDRARLDSKSGLKHDIDATALQRWKVGMTGVPVVDAAMRCMNETGWVHNRLRMVAAMYLTKDLLIDWRVGERYFMEKLIDGDLASNNGGWQWCASTGVDPCPYFRIFNPYSQSTKVDPTGDFIRHWVPELSKLQGPDLHNPSPKIAGKLGYPEALIDHKIARERALRRYKNPGEE